MRSNGLILWRGASLIDGAPIVCIATCLRDRSHNVATGDMVQTYILHRRQSPGDAIASGADRAVCGDCLHRGGSCYVNVAQGPLAVYRAYRAGAYPLLSRARLPLLAGRAIRLGTYGDPAAVPLERWLPVLAVASARTGYTHQWRTTDQRWRQYAMASADTPVERAEAQALGWRTFRVRLPGSPLLAGEVECPKSTARPVETRLTCDRCRACDGATRSSRAVTISIELHGSAPTKRWREEQFSRRTSLPVLGGAPT